MKLHSFIAAVGTIVHMLDRKRIFHSARLYNKEADAAFGQAYGLLIKELRLLARAVLVIDADGSIIYQQLVKEITHEPDYEAVLQALR